ncbi:MAG: carbohydrate ABC transporter substrate-binding protein [Tenericutes bacterium]|nr:carbohydrate ABC transporter substrate-binding protein [Mycoplasmatota bacterium]
MKKIMTLAILGVLAFSLIACDRATTETQAQTTATTTGSSTTNSQTTTAGTVTTGTGTTTATTTTEAVDVCEVDPFAPECITTDTIVLSYADWGDTELNTALINEFMLKYPNITVELRQDITGSGSEFTGNLINAQTAGILPDVFAIDNVPTGINNGMLLDISEFFDIDPDTELIYDNIKGTAVYNGMRLAIPSFQFIKGIFINMTLFDTYNIPLPDKDWDYDEFIALSIEIRQAGLNDSVFGIDPWYGALDFESTFPTQDFADVGYQTWDGTQFNFTSQPWIDAYNAKLDLYAQDVVGNYTAEELSSLGVDWPWYDGLIGMKIDGSWNLWMVDAMYEDRNIEVGFWPYPGGDAGQFPPTILDFSCVSSQTSYPKEAYLLAKWMTFGREGWLTRLALMEDRGDTYLDRYPIADYPEVWEAAEDFIFYIEGLIENIDLLEYSKPDVDKWLPGYKAFWEWVSNPDNDYFTKIDAGLVTPEVFASEWETKLNQLVLEAMALIGQDEDE